MNKIKLFVMSGVIFLMLTACGEKPIEVIYEHLEKAVELEDSFVEQQSPLYEAEKNENELFDEIIKLRDEDFEQVPLLIEEAMASINKRSEMLKVEKESIESSRQEFKQIEKQMNKLDDDLAIKLEQLAETMHERYDSYQMLHEAYVQAINKDRKLFEMLLNEEIEYAELQEQIDEVNESYEKIIEKKDEFNQITKDYNERKRSFYDDAGLEVVTE